MGYILIIAQDRLTRAYIGAQLQEEGFEVIGASDLAGAISHIREEGTPPDLVILDMGERLVSKEVNAILSNLCANRPLLLIYGAWDHPSELEWPSARYELVKPVTVGQIADKARKIVRGYIPNG